MITYRIEFEEMPSGAMRIHLEAPPVAETTLKERLIAKAYSDHVKSILQKLKESMGGRFEIQN